MAEVMFLDQPEINSLSNETFSLMFRDNQACLDVAFDYAEAGLWTEAKALLEKHIASLAKEDKTYPMVLYALDIFTKEAGTARKHENTLTGQQKLHRTTASQRASKKCWSFRKRSGQMCANAKAHYYLGNLLYDKCRREEAIQHWERSCRLMLLLLFPGETWELHWHNVRRKCRARSGLLRKSISGKHDRCAFAI